MPSMNMKMPSMKMIVCRLAPRLAVALVALTVSACALDKQDAPALSGPSEFGLAIVMAASPDQLPRDGTSQSVVTVTVRDAQGRPVSGQRLSLALPTNAPAGAFLSQSEVVTGTSGQATFTVTAPVSGSLGNILISATPVGTNAENATPRTITINANPQNGSVPTAAFTFTPPAPEVGQVVTFDASTTRDEGVACGTCAYNWDFGGDGTASGIIVRHVFGAGGPYSVALTVTDVGGSTSTTQQNVVVNAPGPPTVTIGAPVPSPPIAGQAATFTATTVVAANHRIVSYSWSWGDGASSQTTAASIQHTYANYGPYLVSLTVRDDLNQSSSAFSPITVSSGLTATLTWAPASPSVGQTVTFTATASSNVGSTITNYLFDFGDGTTSQSGAFTTAKHEYAASGAYIVRLTVTDDKGRTQTTAPQTLQVP